MAVATTAVIVAALASLDLRRPVPDPTVDVDDGLATSQNPLTDVQASVLRDQSDPDRLRCEPRGCEQWRFDHAGAPLGAGAVELRGGLIALLVGAHTSDTIDPRSGELQTESYEHRLLAIDPQTGDERWSRPIRDFTSVSGAYRWVKLAEGPDGGGLIVSGATVTAFEPDGAQRWVSQVDLTGGTLRQVWDVVTTPDAVVLRGAALERSSANQTQYVTALDPTTAEVLWTHTVYDVAVLDPDLLLVVEPDGTMRSLLHTTGETLWEGSGPGPAEGWVRAEGPWVAVQQPSGLRLLDPTTGEDVDRVEGWLTRSLVPAEDRWVGTVRELEPGDDPAWWRDEAGRMKVVAMDADGSLIWTSHIGTVRPWADCCPLEVDAEVGMVTVADPARWQGFDLADGDLVGAEVTAREAAPDLYSEGSADVWRPSPGVEVAWSSGGARLDIRTPDGEVVVRGGRGLDVASIDPLVVVDERYLMGVQLVAER